MWGVPHAPLRTRSDFDTLHAMAVAGSLRPSGIGKLIKQYSGLLAHQTKYVFDRTLSTSEDPDGPAPGYIVLTAEDEKTDTITRTQFKRVDDPDAQITRLGFTAAEVQSAINELEAL